MSNGLVQLDVPSKKMAIMMTTRKMTIKRRINLLRVTRTSAVD